LLGAGLVRAVDPCDEVTPVPSAAGAAGTLPVGPGEQGSGLAARPSAGTAPAKRRPVDRRPPQARADESSYNCRENGDLGDTDAQNEHHEQKQSQQHIYTPRIKHLLGRRGKTRGVLLWLAAQDSKATLIGHVPPQRDPVRCDGDHDIPAHKSRLYPSSGLFLPQNGPRVAENVRCEEGGSACTFRASARVRKNVRGLRADLACAQIDRASAHTRASYGAFKWRRGAWGDWGG
jgi:hypothetical protein